MGEWRDITFCEEWRGVYIISSLGVVKRIGEEPGRRPRKLIGPNGEIPERDNGNGYKMAQLRLNGKMKNMYIHRLVAMMFIPNPENKPEVNHKFGIKTDNRATQLEWATESENLQHAYDTGLRSGSVKYIVTCVPLKITTMGCNEMESRLKALGYEKASAAGIWSSINYGKSHLDMEGGQRIGGRVEVRPSDRGGRMTYRVQLIWNREFNFVTYGQHFSDLGEAIEYSEALKDMGDGACVKETRVVDQDGKVVYAYGKPVAQ